MCFCPLFVGTFCTPRRCYWVLLFNLFDWLVFALDVFPCCFCLILYLQSLPADHQSNYIGVPVPRGYRRKRRRRHSSISSHDVTDIERGVHRDHQRHERYESEDTERYEMEQMEHSLHPPEVSRTSEFSKTLQNPI